MLSRLNRFDDPDKLAREIENEVLRQPDGGDLVPGTGGVRKIRVGDGTRGRGKRGGVRVLLLDLPHIQKTHLLFVLAKGEAQDISAEEKKEILQLVTWLKKESKL